jgi:hypothetical protein
MKLEEIINEINNSIMELSVDDLYEIAEHCEAHARAIDEQDEDESEE